MKNRINFFGVVGGVIGMFVAARYLMLSGLHFDGVTASISISTGIALATCILCVGRLFLLVNNYKIKKIEADLAQEEEIIIEGFANYKQNEGNVPGKLVLTSQRFIFYPKSKNISNLIINHSLESILDIEIVKSFGILDSGLKILLSDDEEHFMVDYPNDWRFLIEWQKKVAE